MVPLLVLALSLQAVAPADDRTPRFLDRALEPPITATTAPWDPFVFEVLASLGIGGSMLVLGTIAGVVVPTGGDVVGVFAPHGIIVATVLTPLLSATAVWALEGRARPGRPWWPVLLTSLSIRLVGALMMFVGLFQWQSELSTTVLELGGIALSLVGGTAGEVIVARWGRQPPAKAGPATQLTVFRLAF